MRLYNELTADGGFFKTFFKTLKEGRKIGAIVNVFITGILPVTIDELASAFNIGTFLILNPKFESMLGFTQAEVVKLLDEIYDDYQISPATRSGVNENFYRTTFFELCSRYLSRWFTWNVERSYPSGKSDLEFVGKHHEKFSGLRWVIEFKYYSNTEFKKLKTSIEAFELQEEDKEQIAGYSQYINVLRGRLEKGIPRSANLAVRHLLFWQSGFSCVCGG